MKKIRALFLNSPKAQCSIHESGNMVFSAMCDSAAFDWHYADFERDCRPGDVPYGCVVINCHAGTIPWLDLRQLRKLTCFKGTVILEAVPESVISMCPTNTFDVHLAIDPTVTEVPGRVYALPRPLVGIRPPVTASSAHEITVIGTFGLGTPGEGFERVVDAVNREFDRAIIRVNIRSNDSTNGLTRLPDKLPYVQQVVQLMRQVANPGIVIEDPIHSGNDTESVEWCRDNTVNVLLYDHRRSGISASTDQAIASGRPLLVGDNPAFRHIHRYLPSYPEHTIRDAIRHGAEGVKRMQQDWNAASFRQRMEQALLASAAWHGKSLFGNARVDLGRLTRIAPAPAPAPVPIKESKPKRDNRAVRLAKKVVRALKKLLPQPQLQQSTPVSNRPAAEPAYESPMHRDGVDFLFVNHLQSACGVHQYGRNVATEMRRIPGVRLHYLAVNSAEGFLDYYHRLRPAAVIFNHYPTTMPWLSPCVAQNVSVPKLGFLHEMTQQAVDELDNSLFDYHLISDPTIRTTRADVFLSPRLLPDHCNHHPAPIEPTFGSFGFGFANKGFTECIDRIQDEYDQAKIVLRMPFNDIVDPDGVAHARVTAEHCRARVRKPGIKVEIHHSFLDTVELLSFLSSNTANIFLYDESLHRGISSVLEYALAARRPLIINDCPMFRHLGSVVPEISVHRRSIRDIVERGIAPLVPLYNEWSAAMFRKRWRQFLLNDLVNQRAADSVPAMRKSA